MIKQQNIIQKILQNNKNNINSSNYKRQKYKMKRLRGLID